MQRVAPVLLLALLPTFAAAAASEPASQTCAARVVEAQYELDANQAVFDLLEPLWEAKSTERLRYLRGKRDRDRSKLRVRRSRIARERADAKLAVLQSECFAASPAPQTATDGAEALVRYDDLGCALIEKDEKIAGVELAYARELLAAMTELRSREFATEQQLIQAKFELQRAEMELNLRGKRLRACRARRGGEIGG